MFSQSAIYYDAIYAARGKDYEREAQYLLSLIQQHKQSSGSRLLDVACGTGSHLLYLQKHFHIEGIDINPELLRFAQQKVPPATFHQADMVHFDLGHQFDVVVCLFSSIGYAKTVDRLQAAIQTMQRHVVSGGLLIVEPWFYPDQYHAGSVHAIFVDTVDLKIARMNLSETISDTVSVLDFHYLVAILAGIEHFSERHELGLFTHEQYLSAFVSSGLETIYDEVGLEGRGLYIGIK